MLIWCSFHLLIIGSCRNVWHTAHQSSEINLFPIVNSETRLNLNLISYFPLTVMMLICCSIIDISRNVWHTRHLPSGIKWTPIQKGEIRLTLNLINFCLTVMLLSQCSFHPPIIGSCGNVWKTLGKRWRILKSNNVYRRASSGLICTKDKNRRSSSGLVCTQNEIRRSSSGLVCTEDENRRSNSGLVCTKIKIGDQVQG